MNGTTTIAGSRATTAWVRAWIDPRSTTSLGTRIGGLDPRAVRTWIGGLALVVLTSACEQNERTHPAEEPPAEGDVSPSPDAGGVEAFRRTAHAEAHAALVPVAEQVLAQSDPLAVFERGGSELRPRALDERSLAAVRAAANAAWKDADGLTPTWLSPEDAAVALAIRFGLARARDESEGARPWIGDPTWTTAEVEQSLAALDRALAEGRAVDPGAALAHMGETLRLGIAALGASSPESLAAALEDLRRLEAAAKALTRRTATLPIETILPFHEAASEAMAWLRAIEDTLPRATATSYDAAIVPADTPTAVLRLPARLGAAALAHRLEAEESLGTPIASLFAGLGPTLQQLEHLAHTGDRTTPRTNDSTRREPVDAERCNAVAERLRELATRQPLLSAAGLECTAAVRRWAGQPMTGPELTLAAIELGVIEPLRRARLREELGVLALLRGRIAAPAQALGQTLAVATAMEDEAAQALARERAHAAACLAATALWVHGELGTDDELGTRLRAHCPARAPRAWIALALARPRQALAGLELARLPRGPADVIALDRYFWVPAGLIDGLAHPSPPPAPSPPPFEIHTEDLDPTGKP